MTLNVEESIAAALDAINSWLIHKMERSDLKMEIVNSSSVKNAARPFRQAKGRRVSWDWEQIFYKKVRYKKKAWMFTVVKDGEARGMCYGRIEVENDYVSVDYLERRSDSPEVRGIMALIAVTFATALARLFDVSEIRLYDPFPELVPFYMDNFGMFRHPPEGEVQYLYRKV